MTSFTFAWALAASVVLATGCAAETSDDSDPTGTAPASAPQSLDDYEAPRRPSPGECHTARTDIILGVRADIPTACKHTIGIEDPGEMRTIRDRQTAGDPVDVAAQKAQVESAANR
jgi:hypothetical protein